MGHTKHDERVFKHKAKGAERILVDVLRRKDSLLQSAQDEFDVNWAKLHADPNLFTHLFLLSDGVVVVRYRHDGALYKSNSSLHPNDTMERWSSREHVVPWGPKMVSLPIKGRGSMRMVDCRFGLPPDQLHYERLLIDTIDYQSELLKDPEQTALAEFRLIAAGYLLNAADLATGKVDPDQVIAKLEAIVGEFESILNDAKTEEQVQTFVAANPILFGHLTELVTKQKLGEDFVTDFVIKNVTEAGVDYTLVEIERPNKPVFTTSGQFTAEFTQALQQTISWEAWLDNNKAYLQQKLPGLKTPRFQLVIGRSTNWGDDQKAHFSIRNRRDKSCEVLTYDGLLVRAKELLLSLKNLTAHS